MQPSNNPEFELAVLPEAQAASSPPESRDPVWDGWDVVKIAVFMFTVPFVIDVLLAFVMHRFIYSSLSWQEIAQEPIIELFAEVVAYIGVIFFMIALIEGQYHRRFLDAISWNWPRKVWGLATLGSCLLIVLESLAHFLPIPKNVPFEEFFKHPLEAYLTSILAISFGPLMEELFFRGFLYPILARRLGVAFSIFLTAFAFGMLHAMQLGFAWGAVFIIFLVGLALTIVRAVSNSVGSSLVVHIAYNFTLTAITFIGTGGFRHLEKLQS